MSFPLTLLHHTSSPLLWLRPDCCRCASAPRSPPGSSGDSACASQRVETDGAGYVIGGSRSGATAGCRLDAYCARPWSHARACCRVPAQHEASESAASGRQQGVGQACEALLPPPQHSAQAWVLNDRRAWLQLDDPRGRAKSRSRAPVASCALFEANPFRRDVWWSASSIHYEQLMPNAPIAPSLSRSPRQRCDWRWHALCFLACERHARGMRERPFQQCAQRSLRTSVSPSSSRGWPGTRARIGSAPLPARLLFHPRKAVGT